MIHYMTICIDELRSEITGLPEVSTFVEMSYFIERCYEKRQILIFMKDINESVKNFVNMCNFLQEI